jgi:hypothetical protein
LNRLKTGNRRRTGKKTGGSGGLAGLVVFPNFFFLPFLANFLKF